MTLLLGGMQVGTMGHSHCLKAIFFPCIPFQYNTFHYASRKADAEQHFLYVHGDSVGLLQRVLGMRDVVQKLQLL